MYFLGCLGDWFGFYCFYRSDDIFFCIFFWLVMFFFMLVNFGFGSMFGIIEGIITFIVDIFKVRKEILIGEFLCILFFIELIVYFIFGGRLEMEIRKFY